MSEVAKIELAGFDNIELLTKAVEKLQATGEIERVWTAAQWEKLHGSPPVAMSYDTRGVKRLAAEGNNNALRHGEQLAVVINHEYTTDIAGFTAQASQHGPAGAFVGGVHPGASETRCQEITKKIRVEYSCQMADTAMVKLQRRLGGTIARTGNKFTLTVNGSLGGI